MVDKQTNKPREQLSEKLIRVIREICGEKTQHQPKPPRAKKQNKIRLQYNERSEY